MPFLVVFIIVCLIALTMSIYKSLKFFRRNFDRNLMQFINKFQFTSKQTAQRNCITENHFCVKNTDCVDICQSGSIPFYCNQNSYTCEPYTMEENEPNKIDVVPCNQKHGFINTLSVNILWGNTKIDWVCINTLPKLFNDKDELNSYVCSSGQFPVDVNMELPQANKCKCDSEQNEVLAVHENDKVIPRCIPRELLPLLPSFVAVSSEQ